MPTQALPSIQSAAAFALSLLLIEFALPPGMSGQQPFPPPLGPPVVEPAEALQALVDGTARRTILWAFRRDLPETDMRREGHYDRYTSAQRRQLLDGLERIAIQASPRPPGNTYDPANEAVSLLKEIGLYLRDVAPEAREIPARLLRIYDRAETSIEDSTRRSVMRMSALDGLAKLLALGPAESEEIIDLLWDVATGPGPPEDLPVYDGVRAFLKTCDVGVPYLRRLHDEGLVQHAETAAWLRGLAERGFPVEEIVRARWGEPCPSGGR